MRLLGSTILASAALLAVPAVAQTAQQPMTRTESGAPQAGRPSTVQSITGQTVYREGGQEFGRVDRAVRAGNGQVFLVVAANGRMVMVPAGQLAFQNGRHVMRGDDEQVRAFPEYREGMAGYQPLAAGDSLNIAAGPAQGGQAGQQAGDASRIVVQQPAPAIQVEQASPQVTVQQAQPNVTVRQAQPEIIVRQGAPTVTVDIPQPEIIVRMPRPDVNVAQAQPQVQVRQPQPQVQIVQQQQQQPQVQVHRAEPQVTVQPAQPQVTVQQGQAQPQVRYERAEAQVRVNQAEGQPNVRFEQMQPGQQAQDQQGRDQRAQGQQRQDRTTAATGAGTPDRSASTASNSAGTSPSDTTGTTASISAGAGQTRAFAAQDLMDREIYNLRGQQLGDVERVLIGQGDRAYVVIGHGGFLGLGEKEILLPLDQIRVQGNRLVMPGMTDDQIRAMPEFRRNAAQGYREADRGYSANVGVQSN